MSSPEIRPLTTDDLEAWCREAGGPARRNACMNGLKALFRSGASEPCLLWWLREEGRVLGRLLLLREGEGLTVGELVLPWQGSWRGALKRLLGAALGALDKGDTPFLHIGEEALAEAGVSPRTLGRELEELGFHGAPARVVVELERTRTAPAQAVPQLPAGAELDGADGGVWRLDAAPDASRLSAGLAALAAQGARNLRLEWPGVPQELKALLPDGWVLISQRAPLAWRRLRP